MPQAFARAALLTRCGAAQVYTKVGKEFPTDPLKQLEMAVKAVFDSWECDRARQVPIHPPPPPALLLRVEPPARGGGVTVSRRSTATSRASTGSTARPSRSWRWCTATSARRRAPACSSGPPPRPAAASASLAEDFCTGDGRGGG